MDGVAVGGDAGADDAPELRASYKRATSSAPGLLPQVFISHRGADAPAKTFAASILARELEHAGFRVVMVRGAR